MKNPFDWLKKFWKRKSKLQLILDNQQRIINLIMATEQNLKDALTGITEDLAAQETSIAGLNTSIDNLVTLVTDLRDQVANGGVVSQANLDALVEQAEALDAAGDEVTAGLEAAKAKLPS